MLVLAPIACEDRIVFADGEREKWAHPGGGEEKRLEVWQREEIVTKLRMKDILQIDAATNLEKDDLLLALRECDVRFIEHYGIARALFAKYGLDAIDAVFALVEHAPSSALEVILHFDSPRVLRSVQRDFLLERWCDRFPLTAAIELLPAALGHESDERAKSLKLLKRMRRSGHVDVIREAATQYGNEALAEVDRLFGPERLPSHPPSIPSFVSAATLPRARLLDGQTIDGEAHERLVQLATLLPMQAARDALTPVRDACDRESLGVFASALVDRWLAAGAAIEEKWVLLAAGVLGDDIVARKLADWTTSWTKEKLHARARASLEALSIAGSDVALMHVERLSRTMKKGAIRDNAAATLEAIAKDRSLSQEELADRLVPSFDLDPSGATWLDFGPRKFRVSFDETLAPELFDETGARLERLPRPSSSDDATRAAHAAAMYKGLAADTKKIAPDQVRRLESAMCTERSWSMNEFRRFFVEHPLLVHIARRLVWLTASGATFRIGDDRSFCDSSDRDTTVGDDQRVRIAHPIAIASEVGAWSTLLGDYHVVQPFPQLGRDVLSLTADEKAATILTRFVGVKIPGARFFTLKHRGWSFRDHQLGKSMRDGMVLLTTEPGLGFLASRPEEQTLGEVSLYANTHKPATFGDLTAIEASELLRDLELLKK